jgi:hypothetical protein
MVEHVAERWAAPPTPLGLAFCTLLALATAGWAAAWNTRAGNVFLLFNVGAALDGIGALVGWVVGR